MQLYILVSFHHFHFCHYPFLLSMSFLCSSSFPFGEQILPLFLFLSLFFFLPIWSLLHFCFFVFHFVPREMGIRSLTQAVPEEEAAEEEVLSLLIAIRIMVSSFLSTFPSLLVSHPDKIISRKESKSAASKS